MIQITGNPCFENCKVSIKSRMVKGKYTYTLDVETDTHSMIFKDCVIYEVGVVIKDKR